MLKSSWQTTIISVKNIKQTILMTYDVNLFALLFVRISGDTIVKLAFIVKRQNRRQNDKGIFAA